MSQSLEAAREYGVRVYFASLILLSNLIISLKFESGTVSAEFENKDYTFDFRYRDPWKWIVNLVTDPSLANSIVWFPSQKVLHDNGKVT